MSAAGAANRRPVGASTITQQVAKNMLLSNEISIERKVKEILLATRIEEALPKDRILELYLNEIYLGSGAYGVAAAALTYFDKSLDELTLGEAAFLAGLPKAPNNYNPARFPQAAKARRDWVLDRMVEDGARDRRRKRRRPRHEPLELRHRQEAENRSERPISPRRCGANCSPAMARRSLYGAGCRCAPASMQRLQAAADKALRTGLIAYERSHGGWRGADCPYRSRRADWAAHLAAVPVPGGRRRCRLAASRWCCAPKRTARRSALQGRRRPGASRSPRCAGRGRCATTARSVPRPRGAADVVKPGDLVHGRAADRRAAESRKRSRAATTAGRSTILCQIPEVSGALVAMDPHTGRVLAMSGGFSFEIEPVQPRDPGQAAARLVDQAVRLPDRAR